MQYPYQKDGRVLPGNLQNREYSFLLPPKCNVFNYSPTFFLFSLLYL
jgi:hypothetical protein